MGVRLKLAVAGVAVLLATPVAAQELPPLVAAYSRQLAEQCGPLPPGATAPSLVDRLDLNGDKVDDWVIDASRYPCPGRPALAAAAGSQVTVFRGIENGIAVPAFQRMAFGLRIKRTPQGAPELLLTLGGSDCGSADSASRCERQVVWHADAGRFDALSLRPVGAAKGG